MKSQVTLFAALLLVLVLLVITSHGTDKSLRSPSRGLQDFPTNVDDISHIFANGKKGNKGNKGKKGNKGNKGKKGKKGEKGNKGNKGKKGKKGNKGTTPAPTPAPTPALLLEKPCLDDITFPTALDAWFSDPTSATSTYGNITDW